MSALRASAPAKVNLGLLVGPVRALDGRHELVTVMQSISLSDELLLRQAPAAAIDDEVICPALPGPAHENLAAQAIALFRERTGWDAPPQLMRIDKRIPVAAGLGGGSADAAAALRLLRAASGLGDEELLHGIAIELGADVPAQLAPGRWLATGAGERLTPLPCEPGELAMLVLPAPLGLSTADVYRRADELAPPRSAVQLDRGLDVLKAAASQGHWSGAGDPLQNDLQAAAISLCPQISGAMDQAAEAGADRVLVSGSGPTVIGLFLPREPGTPAPMERAMAAAAALAGRRPAPICAEPVGEAFAAAGPVDGA